MKNCPSCGAQSNWVAQYNQWHCPNCNKYHSAAPSQPQAQNELIGKLMPKLPMLVSFSISVIVAMISPTWAIAGVVAGMAAGFVLWKLMNPSKPIVPPESERPSYVSRLVSSVGRLMITMVLIAPIASGGLFLPTLHNPNTFMKYLSVIIVLPENLTAGSPFPVFPGIPILVIAGLALLVLGTYIPEKYLKKIFDPVLKALGSVIPEKILRIDLKIILQILGMIILILAPLITLPFAYEWSKLTLGYAIISGLGFLGIALQLFPDKVSGLIFKPQGRVPGPAMYSFALALPLAFPVFATLSGGGSNFESDHHTVAGVLAGILGGFSAIDFVPWYQASPIGPSTSPIAPTFPIPQQPSGPQNGQVLEVTDHRGQKMDVTYDSRAGKWVTSDGYWFDPSKADQARAEAQAGREWSAQEHEKIARGDTAMDRKLDSIHQEGQRQIEAIKQEGIKRRKREILEERRDIREGESKMWIEQADRENRAVKVAEGVEKAADVGVDVLSNVVGPAGKPIKYGYGALKNLGGNVSEAAHQGTSMTKAVGKAALQTGFDMAFDAAKNKIMTPPGDKVPSIFEPPGPSLEKIGKLDPGVFKETMIDSTIRTATADAAQNQLEQATITDPAKELVGLK